MDSIWRMVRHGARSLAKSPAFTLATILLIGLGVGSVTTIFTLVDHVLLRPLPYSMAEQLFQVQGKHSSQDFEDLQQLRSAEMWAAVPDVRDASLTGVDRPARLRQAQISRDFFALFDARPSLGRLLVADDFRNGESVVVSDGTWRLVFGGDPEVIGRSVLINGTSLTIVGVLDASFVAPEALVGNAVDIWRPIAPAVWSPPTRDNFFLRVAGRLREDGSLAALAVEANALARTRALEFPDRYVDRTGEVRALPVVGLHEATVSNARVGLRLLLGAVTLLLLVACTNVALLFLARGQGRLGEMAIRRVLGARTSSLAGQLLCESMLVATAGAILGLLFAGAGLRAALTLGPEVLPRLGAVTIDVRILAFALSIAISTALVFGLLPAMRLARADVAATLQRARGSTAGRGARQIQAGLVVMEVALSLVLVTQAGLLMRSFALLHRQDPGFRTDNVWTLPLSPRGITDGEEWVRRMEAVRSSLADVPGVRAATYGFTMPLEFTGGARCCWHNYPVFNGVEHSASVVMHPVDADYFDLLQLRITAGASWSRAEQDQQPGPALLSEGLAVAVFGSALDALSREMRLLDMDFRIAGVVADNRHYGPDQSHGPAVYLPITTASGGPAHMAVLVDRPYDGLADRLREAVWRVEPDLPVPTVRALDEWAASASAGRRFESLLFATFGTVALVLMAAGLCGTLLYAVGRRRRELGIRLALGEAPARLEGRILGQGLRIAAAGCAIGIAGAWIFGRLLQSRLFGIQAHDPVTIASAVAVLLGVVVLSSWLPARRAAATDPMGAIRAE
jgi:predicted permease